MRKKLIPIFLSLLIFSSCGIGKNRNDDKSEEVVNISDIIANVKQGESEKEIEETAKSKTEEKKSEKKNDFESKKEENPQEKENDKEKEKDKGKVTVDLRTFGDIMCHSNQFYYANAVAGGGDQYDFSGQFNYIKDYIEDADFAIGNYETTSYDKNEYSGYPTFNTPSSYITDIKNAGFDCLTTANNHCLDQGMDGLFATIDAMDKAGISHVGSQKKRRAKLYS